MRTHRCGRLMALVALLVVSAPVAADTGSLAGRLHLAIELNATAWLPDEPEPRAVITFTNVSSQALNFDRPTAGPRGHMQYGNSQWLTMTDSQGATVPSMIGVYVELPPGTQWPPTVSLEPNESFCYCMSLGWWGYDLSNLGPDIYQIQAVYEYFDVSVPSFDDPDAEEQWTDENHQLLFSNTVQLEVLSQGAKAPPALRLARDGVPAGRSMSHMLVKGDLVADARLFTDAGAKVKQEAGNATVTRGDRVVSLPVGRWSKELKGKHPPAIPVIGGGLMVPVRYVAESLGMTVAWNPKTKTANIITG